MRSQMFPQVTCLKGCIVTLAAFVCFFSTVCFQMCPQIACLRESIVTLVAFVWLFSAVHSQMCPQIVCISRCIVTLVAFVRLFFHCAFPNVSSSHLPPRMKSHTGCICLIFFTVHLQVSLQIACHRGWIGYIRLTSFHHFSLLLEHFHHWKWNWLTTNILWLLHSSVCTNCIKVGK